VRLHLRGHLPLASYWLCASPTGPRAHDPTALAPHDSTALAPHDSTGLHLGPGHPTLDSNAARAAPLCQLWTCQARAPKSQAHGVRYGVGRDCRGCLRAYAYTTSTVPGTWGRPVTAPACSSQHLTVCAISSPSREGTQRDEPAQAKPPRCSPFGDANKDQNPRAASRQPLPSKRERTQVRLASRVVHPGGFGTCVPGAWSEHAHMQSDGEGLGNPHSASHLQPESKLRPGARHCPTRPNRSSRAGPGTKLREHGLIVPKVNQTEGLRNPHSATRQQPNQPPARNPPLPAATKSLQSCGDRDRIPTQMSVISVETRYQCRAPRHLQNSTLRDILMRGPTV
jgi:hypothetical protein